MKLVENLLSEHRHFSINFIGTFVYVHRKQWNLRTVDFENPIGGAFENDSFGGL